jgi:hypothetical protein
MKKGYQVIEPSTLHPLFANSKYDVFAVAFLSWLCELLRLEFRDQIQYVEFDVISVSYGANYPAIGIHYKDQDYHDIGPAVEASIDRNLREKSAMELIKFLTEGGVDWNEVSSRKMAE